MVTSRKKRAQRPAKGGVGVARESPTEVVQIYKGRVPHLYVEERCPSDLKRDDGTIDVPKLAKALGQHEKSVYRSLREPSRIWKEIQLWADALGLDDWRDLTMPPGHESVDKIIAKSLGSSASRKND